MAGRSWICFEFLPQLGYLNVRIQPPPDERQALLIGQFSIIIRVLLDQAKLPVVDGNQFRYVLIVNRPNLCRLVVRQLEICADELFSMGTNVFPQNVQILIADHVLSALLWCCCLGARLWPHYQPCQRKDCYRQFFQDALLL